jgi:thiamine-phosphate pyrophosphorylase
LDELTSPERTVRTATPDAPSLWLVTDRRLVRGGDLASVVSECLAAGLPAVQLREKDLGAADLAALARPLREITRAGGALLSINDRVDVALVTGADAVQRTSTSLEIADIRTLAHGRLRIGASTHSRAEAEKAERDGADWIVFGPVYDTPSKRPFGPPQGLAKLAETARAVRIPVIAIGGITPERVGAVCDAGARGVAVISAILGADSPAKVTARFVEALSAHAGARGRRDR